MSAGHEFTATLWRWLDKEGRPGAWYFISLPFDLADEIEASRVPGPGFGSVRVEVVIGSSRWQTSLFPSAEQKTYVLPVKKQVRTAQGLDEGSPCTVGITLL
ncbi:DUF1905 domain-containing protein [Nocardioides daejeonensis]|uniref:DUF1905 domain-containing protein n=1 Tax=Nocardioides daejeonensis TaxID=1046556 RepID=UPI000D746FC9|nr:DUF1905 domain-containing protein [Nocardioides daejeonensis]